MNAIKTVDKGLMRLTQGLIVFCITAMSVILVANVLARLFFSRSIVSAEELGRYCVIVITFVGMSYVAREDKHVKISTIFDIMPPKMKKAMVIIIDLVTSGLLFFLASQAYRYTLSAVASGRVSSALRVPSYLVNAVVCLGLVLVALEYLVQLALNVVDREHLYMGRTPYNLDGSDKEER